MKEWFEAGALDDFPCEELVALRIAGIDLVFLRKEDQVVALRDRCAHRFAPLSWGKLVNDTIQCPYHGLRFGLDGVCVGNPHGDGKIPERARVTTYEVAVRDGRVLVSVG